MPIKRKFPLTGDFRLTNQYQPNRSLPRGTIEVGAIITTDNLSRVLNPLPGALQLLLNFFGLSDRFTGKGGSVIFESRSQITMNDSGLADFGINSRFINASSAQAMLEKSPSLPAEVVDISRQINQTCPTGRNATDNQFIITGRGGLPDNPNQSLNSDA